MSGPLVEVDIAPAWYPPEWVPVAGLTIRGYQQFTHFAYAVGVSARIGRHPQRWERLATDRIRITT